MPDWPGLRLFGTFEDVLLHDFNAYYDVDDVIVACGVSVQVGAAVTF